MLLLIIRSIEDKKQLETALLHVAKLAHALDYQIDLEDEYIRMLRADENTIDTIKNDLIKMNLQARRAFLYEIFYVVYCAEIKDSVIIKNVAASVGLLGIDIEEITALLNMAQFTVTKNFVGFLDFSADWPEKYWEYFCWYAKNLFSQCSVGDILYDNNNQKIKSDCIGKLFETANVNAALILYDMYESGDGIEKNELEANRFCLIAASKGNEKARDRVLNKIGGLEINQEVIYLSEKGIVVGEFGKSRLYIGNGDYWNSEVYVLSKLQQGGGSHMLIYATMTVSYCVSCYDKSFTDEKLIIEIINCDTFKKKSMNHLRNVSFPKEDFSSYIFDYVWNLKFEKMIRYS